MPKKSEPSALRIPGFNAEASLYDSPAAYRSTGGSRFVRSGTQTSGTHIVRPAAPYFCGDCTCNTYDFGEPGTCARLCIDTIHGEPYAVQCLGKDACTPPCDQKTCGPCTQECTYPSGYSVTQTC